MSAATELATCDSLMGVVECRYSFPSLDSIYAKFIVNQPIPVTVLGEMNQCCGKTGRGLLSSLPSWLHSIMEWAYFKLGIPKACSLYQVVTH